MRSRMRNCWIPCARSGKRGGPASACSRGAWGTRLTCCVFCHPDSWNPICRKSVCWSSSSCGIRRAHMPAWTRRQRRLIAGKRRALPDAQEFRKNVPPNGSWNWRSWAEAPANATSAIIFMKSRSDVRKTALPARGMPWRWGCCLLRRRFCAAIWEKTCGRAYWLICRCSS